MPASAPVGCYVPVTMRVAGKAVSNTVTIAVDNAETACSDPISGAYTKGGKFGTLALIRRLVRVEGVTPPDLIVDVAMAGFSQEAGAEFSFNSIASLPPAGSCMVYQGIGDFTNADVPFATQGKALLAGTVTVRAPNRTVTLFSGLNQGASEHMNLLGSSGVLPEALGSPAPLLSPGAYTVAATGGADVGAFSASITVPNTSLQWTNRDQLSTIDRTQPLTFNWTGTSFLVALEGVNYDAPTNSSAAFRCIAPAGATTFTVPSWILANFGATRTDPNGSRSLIGIATATAPVTFQATGLDNTAAFYLLLQGKRITFK